MTGKYMAIANVARDKNYESEAAKKLKGAFKGLMVDGKAMVITQE